MGSRRWPSLVLLDSLRPVKLMQECWTDGERAAPEPLQTGAGAVCVLLISRVVSNSPLCGGAAASVAW